MSKVNPQLVPMDRRVKELREKRGETQEAVAQLLGHSERWMVEVDAGRVDVKLTDLMGWPDVLGVLVRPERLSPQLPVLYAGHAQTTLA